MKRLIALTLCLAALLGCTACSGKETKEISCGELIDAYEEAGYEVFHKETITEDWEYTCYVKAEDPATGAYIFFHFFETPEAAERYAGGRQWNVVLWLYSLASFNPTWLTTKTYGNIEYEYRDPSFVKPFNQLIKG